MYPKKSKQCWFATLMIESIGPACVLTLGLSLFGLPVNFLILMFIVTAVCLPNGTRW